MTNSSIQTIMCKSPQQWTIHSILTQHYGKILLQDNERGCLNVAQFYFMEGPFLLSFAESFMKQVQLPAIIISSNEAWYAYLLEQMPNVFQLLPRKMYVWSNQVNKLHSYLAMKSNDDIRPIDKNLAKQIEKLEWAEGVFDSYEGIDGFLDRGFGYCILDKNKIISLCMSFAHSTNGVEIEVDTDSIYQGQGLGKIVSAHFVAESLRRHIAPLWDASNVASAKIAEAIGFEFLKEYVALYSQEGFTNNGDSKFDK